MNKYKQKTIEFTAIWLVLVCQFSLGNTNKELWEAVEKKDVHTVKELLKASASPNFNTLYPPKPSVLLYSVSQGDIHITEALIKSGAHLGYVNNAYETALHIAVKKQNMQMVNLLIKSGVNIDSKNYSGETALHIAVKKQDPQIVNLLISNGCNELIYDKRGYIPLDYAIKNNDTLSISLLIKNQKALDISKAALYDKSIKTEWVEGMTSISLSDSNSNSGGYHIPITIYSKSYQSLPNNFKPKATQRCWKLDELFSGVWEGELFLSTPITSAGPFGLVWQYNRTKMYQISFCNKNYIGSKYTQEQISKIESILPSNKTKKITKGRYKFTKEALQAQNNLELLLNISSGNVSINKSTLEKTERALESNSDKKLGKIMYVSKLHRLFNSPLPQHRLNIQFLRAGYFFMVTSDINNNPLNGTQEGANYVENFTYKTEIQMPSSIYNGITITLGTLEFKNFIVQAGKIQIGFPSSSEMPLYLEKRTYANGTKLIDTVTIPDKKIQLYASIGLGGAYRLRITDAFSLSAGISFLYGIIDAGDYYGNNYKSTSGSYYSADELKSWNIRAVALPINIGTQLNLKSHFPIKCTFEFDPLIPSFRSTLSMGITVLGENSIFQRSKSQY